MYGRKQTQICALLAIIAVFSFSAFSADEAPKPLKALLVCGGCCHDYTKQKTILKKGLEERCNIEVTIAHDPDNGTKHKNPIYDNPDWAKGYDVIIHDECSADVKDLDVINNVILKPHMDGLPGVVLHCGMHCYRSEGWPEKAVTPWFKFTGLETTGHGAQLPIEITYVDTASPITKGLENWTTIHEELYNNIHHKLLDTAHPLARGKQTSKDKEFKEKIDDNICTWTNMFNEKTRVFATTVGHNNETCSDPKYLDLVTRGLLWACNKLGDDGKPIAGYGPVTK